MTLFCIVPELQLIELHCASARQHCQRVHPSAAQYVLDAPVINVWLDLQDDANESHLSRVRQHSEDAHPDTAHDVVLAASMRVLPVPHASYESQVSTAMVLQHLLVVHPVTSQKVDAAALISCFPDGQLTELHRGSAAQHLLDSHPDAEQYVVAAPVILAMPAPQVIDSHVARPVQQWPLVHPRAAQKVDPALGLIVIGAAPIAPA